MCGIHSGLAGCSTALALIELSQLCVWLVQPPLPTGYISHSYSCNQPNLSHHYIKNTKSCTNHDVLPALQLWKQEAQKVYFGGESSQLWIFYFSFSSLFSRHLPLSALKASHAPRHGAIVHTPTALNLEWFVPLQHTFLHSLDSSSVSMSSCLRPQTLILTAMGDHMCVMVKAVLVNAGSSVSSKTQTPFVRMKGMIPDKECETLTVENFSVKIHVKALTLYAFDEIHQCRLF